MEVIDAVDWIQGITSRNNTQARPLYDTPLLTQLHDRVVKAFRDGESKRIFRACTSYQEDGLTGHQVLQRRWVGIARLITPRERRRRLNALPCTQPSYPSNERYQIDRRGACDCWGTRAFVKWYSLWDSSYDVKKEDTTTGYVYSLFSEEVLKYRKSLKPKPPTTLSQFKAAFDNPTWDEMLARLDIHTPELEWYFLRHPEAFRVKFSACVVD